MTMGIEKARDQVLALAVKLKIHIARPLVAAIEQLLDPPFVIDDHSGKADHLALAVERHAIDIVDQAVGLGKAGHQ